MSTYYHDADLLGIGLFADDRDSPTTRARTNQIVTTRKPHDCMWSPTIHKIAVGARARVERAVRDDRWCSFYVCVDCLTAFLEELEEVE